MGYRLSDKECGPLPLRNSGRAGSIDGARARSYSSGANELKVNAMSLANGRHYLAIPGPSVMPDRVLNAMHQPAPNIYTGALPDMVEALIPDLKAVAGASR